MSRIACYDAFCAGILPLADMKRCPICGGLFFQSSDARLTVIHRAELVQIQRLGQLAGIDAVVLVPDFQ